MLTQKLKFVLRNTWKTVGEWCNSDGHVMNKYAWYFDKGTNTGACNWNIHFFSGTESAQLKDRAKRCPAGQHSSCDFDCSPM